MLLDVGILLGIYIGVRLIENKGKQLKNKSLAKAKISPAKSVVKKNLTSQPVTKPQPLLKDTISNYHEKKHDYYLKISFVSMGLAAIGIFLPPLHLLSIALITYTSLPILKHAETSIISRSHAPAWECIGDAPASRERQRLDAGASRMGSNKGAWEPEKKQQQQFVIISQ